MVSTKNALEMLWLGLCSIYVREKKINPNTKRTEFVETELITDQPCKLSFETIKSTEESNHVAGVRQAVKLFISPNITIPAGSKIVVIQNDVTGEYQNSGVPPVFTNHQEIALELFKGWA